MNGGESIGSKIYDWVNKPKTKEPEAKGDKLHQMNIQKQELQSQPAAAPTIVNNNNNVTQGKSTTTFSPVQGSPRNRESYFDRAMQNTFAK
jgi:hypothetical protein